MKSPCATDKRVWFILIECACVRSNDNKIMMATSSVFDTLQFFSSFYAEMNVLYAWACSREGRSQILTLPPSPVQIYIFCTLFNIYRTLHDLAKKSRKIIQNSLPPIQSQTWIGTVLIPTPPPSCKISEYVTDYKFFE